MAPSLPLFVQHHSPLPSTQGSGHLQAKFGPAAKHTPLEQHPQQSPPLLACPTTTTSHLRASSHEDGRGSSTRNTPSSDTLLTFYKVQPTPQRASSRQRQVGKEEELVASRREVTSGVSGRTGGATQISQFPLQSHCCLMRGSGFTSQNCQITHFLPLFCPPPLPTRSLPYSAQALAGIFTPIALELQLPLQPFLRSLFALAVLIT